MPIAPHHRWLYPIDWRELSRAIRFGRAQGRCEHCGRPHGRRVVHLGDGRGRRVRQPEGNFIELARTTRVNLACAHLDHDPTSNRPRNLAALCQRCHMLHDAPEHRRRRWLNAYRRRAIGDFLVGL